MTSISDDTLRGLSNTERVDLLIRLQAMSAAAHVPSGRALKVRHWFPRFLAACCVLLLPWIAALAVQLPRQYVADQWRLTWIGFDVALLATLAWAAWTLWRQRPIAIAATVAAATLLLTDAWFDVTTARTGIDLAVSASTALLIEIPLAGSLLLISWRVRRVISQVYAPALGR